MCASSWSIRLAACQAGFQILHVRESIPGNSGFKSLYLGQKKHVIPASGTEAGKSEPFGINITVSSSNCMSKCSNVFSTTDKI